MNRNESVVFAVLSYISFIFDEAEDTPIGRTFVLTGGWEGLESLGRSPERMAEPKFHCSRKPDRISSGSSSSSILVLSSV